MRTSKGSTQPIKPKRMFQTFNNSIAVEVDWFIGNLVTESNYKQLVSRKKIVKLQSGGNGRKALIDYETLPEKFKQKIIELVGSPHKKVKQNAFNDFLINDLSAVNFFNTYTLSNGEGLPQKNISEYVANANILNAVTQVLGNLRVRSKALGGKSTGAWERISELIQALPQHTYPHSLPENHRRLKEKYQNYINDGYQSLIHKGFCNNNSEKINDDAKLWILSRWADQVNKCASTRQLFNEYNKRAAELGWKLLESDQTIFNYLHHEEVKHLWWGHRYGELKAKEKFMYQQSTILPTMRDSLWYSDGTKLNYFYMDEDGKVATCQVYEVMDAFSEVLLGYHISKTENFEAQFNAYKQALKTSGFRPYQIGYDNQGGHKKLQNGDFLQKLSRLSINTQPYNGKSKTIENAFGRFQEQILKQDWFFTGQNITAKKQESKANNEFILANKSNLPTLKEIEEVYKRRRAEWNNAKHPKTGVARMEMYLNSVNPEAKEVAIWDMIDLFWITRPKPVMLTAYGLSFKESKVEYQYMVYDADGYPNQQWLQQNIDKKFVIKYDPDDMTIIQVFEQTPNGLRFETAMTTKVQIHRGKQEQLPGEMEFYAGTQQRINEARIETRNKMEEILRQHGATAEQQGLISPNIKGLESAKRKSKNDYGKHLKRESELVPVIDENEHWSKLI